MSKYIKLIAIILVCSGIAIWFALAKIYFGLIIVGLGSASLIKLWMDQNNNSK